jgi:hypothetical protein
MIFQEFLGSNSALFIIGIEYIGWIFLGIEGVGPEFAKHRLESKSDHTLKPELSVGDAGRVHSDFENSKVLAKSSSNPSSPPPLIRGCILLVGAMGAGGVGLRAAKQKCPRLQIRLQSTSTLVVYR